MSYAHQRKRFLYLESDQELRITFCAFIAGKTKISRNQLKLKSYRETMKCGMYRKMEVY